MRALYAAAVFVPLLLAALPCRSDEPAPTPIPFEPRPPAEELEPQNADERDASIIMLDYRVEFSGVIRSWSNRHTTVKRHRARYLIQDNRGVEAIKQHTFFGDETNVTVGEVRGQTISPNGSVHPIDPDRDIRELDFAFGKRKKDLLRTVNFPRVESGAILDLEWMATSGYPGLETINLYFGFPARKMTVKAQGKLSGGANTKPGFGNQSYWVPFVISRAPEGTVARLSSLMGFELTAHDLPVQTDEPNAPPDIRNGAMLGLVPKDFPGRKWRDHVYLFDTRQALPEQEELEVVWTTASMDDNAPLVEFDELGLQVVPLSDRNARGMKSLQVVLKMITRDYGPFVGGTKTGETPAQLEEIAPASEDWQTRVDRIFRYAREQVRLDPEIRNWNRLDKLKNKGTGNGKSLQFYVTYLLDTAGIENDLVLAISRRDVPLLTLFDNWYVYRTRTLMIEVRGPGGATRYLEPSDVLADSWSFSDAYLGGMLFRDSGDPKADWPVDRLPVTAQVRERMVLEFAADAGAASGGTGLLTVAAAFHGSSASAMRWMIGRRTEDADPADLDERRMDYLRGWLAVWAGTNLPENFSMEVVEPDENLWEPYLLAAELPWQANVQEIGEKMILPAFPRVLLFQNPFVAEQRRHPLWLRGGDFEVSMAWRLLPDMRPSQLRKRESSGPDGLYYRLEQHWDEAQSVLTSTLTMRQPYMLPATAYPEVRKLFENMLRETRMSVLIERYR